MRFGRQDAQMDEHAARGLLTEMRDLRAETRRHLATQAWRWMGIWAVVCLGAAASAFTPMAGWYWLLAVPIGLAATAFVGVRIERRVPVQRKAWPYWAIGGGIGALNTLGSVVFEDSVLVVWVWVVLGLGFAALAGLDRQRSTTLALIFATGATVFAGFVVDDTFVLYPYLGCTYALVLGAFAFRTRSVGRR